MSRKFVLMHNRAPGDITVLTALARDLKLTHPEFEIDVDTTCGDLWRNNPHLTPGLKKNTKPGIEFIKCQYGKGIREQNTETIHFLSYFHRDFKEQTGLDIPLQHPIPDLHLSQEERDVSLIDGRYWAVISGGKSDFTAKVWHTPKLQEVCNRIVDRLGVGVVQMGSTDTGHWHPPINNALRLVGQTNLRDMLRLIYHSDGVICGVTAAMHMAAALGRPCVVFAGGREAWWWEAYVNENIGFGPVASGKLQVPHRFLHTIGLLDCCQAHGCWKNKVVKINEDNSLCKYPVQHPGQAVPLCLDMLSADHVWEAVQSYYRDGTLAPSTGGIVGEHQQLSPAGEQARQEDRLPTPMPMPTTTRRPLLELSL